LDCGNIVENLKSMYQRLPASEKLKLIKKYKRGESVTKICLQAGISRTTFYSWLKKYKKTKTRGKTKALASKVASGKDHWKVISPEIQSQVLKISLKNPQFSPKQISSKVCKDMQAPAISPKGAWSVLKKKDLNTKEKRITYISRYGQGLIREISVEEKLTLVRRYLGGDKITDLCQEFGISRTIFYKWYQRYHKAPEAAKKEALVSLRPREERHWRFIPEAKELVLKVVIEKPELSCHKIPTFLPQKEGKPILGSHGVYNLLKKLNLNTYQQRLVYSQSQKEVVAPIFGLPARIKRLIGKIPAISAIPPPARLLQFLRDRRPELFKPFIYSFFSSIPVSLLLIFWLRMIAQTPTLGSKLGLIFASLSLGIGSFFFAYSMK
jgi:transposase-like protein